MAPSDHERVLEIVDLVLGDLRLRDRMYTARRPDPEHPDVIVIQTGEAGRHSLDTPSLERSQTLEAFIADAQAHLRGVYDQVVPLCPSHRHALVADVTDSTIRWLCPDGTWSCRLGDYEESTWPPPLGAGDLAAALCARLHRRGVTGWRRIECVEGNGRWMARVGIWPMSQAIIDAITRAAAPLRVEFEPCQDRRIRVAALTDAVGVLDI